MFCFLNTGLLMARDINLDAIYIKKSSPYLSRLLSDKLDAYQSVNAQFVDRDIIFSGWVSGYELLYIKELPALNLNIFYLYHVDSRKSRELCRLPGVITIARMAPGGGFIALKRLIQDNGPVPRGETIICHIPGGRIERVRSSWGFLDFDLPADGKSLVHESKNGFMEYFPDSGIERPVLARSRYAEMADPGNPTIALFSPDRGSILVINGGGGSYTAKILRGSRSLPLNGITSAGEVQWLNSSTLVYRSGYTGNFSVIRYNVPMQTSTRILTNSMNTGLSLSSHSKLLALLKDQVVHIYGLPEGRLVNTGIEGEDISFSPLGGRFTSLIFKKLFVANIHTVLKKQIELRRCWEAILAHYRELKDSRPELENEYSLDYINRKINLYSSMLKKP